MYLSGPVFSRVNLFSLQTALIIQLLFLIEYRNEIQIKIIDFL